MKKMTTPDFEINVALLGNVSAGKSTVLNALLKDKYSEVAMKRTTAGVNYFRLYQKTPDLDHDADVDCCPSLPDHPRTADSTLDEITTDNRIKLTSAIDPTVQEKYFDVELEHNLVEMRDDTRLVLIDIPGLNEAGTDHYKEFVNSRWHTFDCVILVMDSKQGVNTQDQMFLLNLIKTNTTTVKKVPVIILCNKVDDPFDEELALLVVETRMAVEKIFGVGCRKEALCHLLDREHAPVDASPAFLPISAINAYIHQCTSQMGLEKFRTFEKDLIDKLGREQLGRLRWNKLDDEEKIKQVFDIVTDPEACKEVLYDSNFHTLLDTLAYFVGGDSRQLSIHYHQISTTATLLATKPLKDGEISNQLWSVHQQALKLHSTQAKSSQSHESFGRDFVLGTASDIFWRQYSEWECDAKMKFSSSWSRTCPQCQFLARPMKELIGYYMFINATTLMSTDSEKDRILASMNGLVCWYLDELLQRQASAQGAFEDAVPIRTKDQLNVLNCYDWSLLFRSVLLLAHNETFCNEFGPQMILLQMRMPDSRGWLAANFRAQETKCRICKSQMVANSDSLSSGHLPSAKCCVPAHPVSVGDGSGDTPTNEVPTFGGFGQRHAPVPASFSFGQAPCAQAFVPFGQAPGRSPFAFASEPSLVCSFGQQTVTSSFGGTPPVPAVEFKTPSLLSLGQASVPFSPAFGTSSGTYFLVNYCSWVNN